MAAEIRLPIQIRISVKLFDKIRVIITYKYPFSLKFHALIAMDGLQKPSSGPIVTEINFPIGYHVDDTTMNQKRHEVAQASWSSTSHRGEPISIYGKVSHNFLQGNSFSPVTIISPPFRTNSSITDGIESYQLTASSNDNNRNT